MLKKEAFPRQTEEEGHARQDAPCVLKPDAAERGSFRDRGETA